MITVSTGSPTGYFFIHLLPMMAEGVYLGEEHRGGVRGGGGCGFLGWVMVCSDCIPMLVVMGRMESCVVVDEKNLFESGEGPVYLEIGEGV